MMRVIQHVPGFVEAEPQRGNVKSVEALLALPWVKRWAEESGFHRWVQGGESGDDMRLLMCEHDGGQVWWVVARVWGSLDPLPVWVDPGSSTEADEEEIGTPVKVFTRAEIEAAYPGVAIALRPNEGKA